MDGSFVPNISFGLPVCEAVKRVATKPIDVHLMIVQPDRYLEAFRDAGAASISVHYEACVHLHRTLQQIRQLGCLAGVALNPHTRVEWLEDLLGDLDFVNLMTVNPGFGAQKFIPSSLKKIEALRKMIDRQGADVLIEIDGGVDLNNYRQIVEAGATVLVAGNAVFKAPDPTAVIAQLKQGQKA
jgi:ribulose-phosphate 3-epimerase